MKLGFAWTLALAAPSAASGQTPSNAPAGSPLGAMPLSSAASEQVQLDAQRARLQAATRARASAQATAEAFAPSTTTAGVDEGRPRSVSPVPTYGQEPAPTEAAARASLSPYGGYYQIRTPWDRR